jgi:undecaprenyl-diphosphatase
VEFLKAIFLALVEGVTEFLPISSTGHLIIAEEYVRLTNDTAFNNAFMVVIQLPAILSVVVYFWNDLWPFGKKTDTPATMALWFRIGIAFLPAAVLGVLFDDFIEAKLFAPRPVALALIIGGIALIGLELRHPRIRISSTAEITVQAAFLIGCFQCLAMIPGTSRSAATIIGAMALGASRPAAAKFSFFLAVPTMLGATAYTLLKSGLNFSGGEWGILAIGSLVSFLTALAVIAVFMNYIRRRDFKVFGVYRIILGILVLLLL